MTTLLPCPHCEKPAMWLHKDRGGYAVICGGTPHCLAAVGLHGGGTSFTETAAAEAWNRRALVQEGLAVPAWQDIETAPDDGTPVLLHWGGGYHPLTGHYENGKWGFLGFDWGFNPFPTQPKFWMPTAALPAAPAQAEGAT